MWVLFCVRASSPYKCLFFKLVLFYIFIQVNKSLEKWGLPDVLIWQFPQVISHTEKLFKWKRKIGIQVTVFVQSELD